MAEEIDLDGYIPSEEQLRQTDSLLEITRRCEEAGIVALVCGGYGLDGLYGKLTRPHDDVDILVVGKEYSRLASGLTDILEGLGYTHQDIAGTTTVTYRNDNISPNFQVSFDSVDLLGQFTKEGVDYFVPKEPNAVLNGQSFRAATLRGQKRITEIQNARAEKEDWGNYPEEKRFNQNALITELEQRGVI